MDKQKSTSFRDQLLLQEKVDSQLQKTFQQEAKKMYTEKLKKRQRFAYVLISFVIAIFTLFFWALSKVFTELQIPYGDPLIFASTWAMFSSMVLIVLCLWPAVCGKIGLRFYPKVIRFVFLMLILAIAMIFCAILELLEKAGGSSPTLAAWVFTMMTLVVVIGVYMLLSGRIDSGDMKNKAKTLELEYRLAELEEKLDRANQSI